METKALIFRTWDDLVFANRNKDYGAYPIRRAYFRRVVLGTGVSVAFLLMLLFLPGILQRFGQQAVKPTVIACVFPTINLTEVPPIVPKDPPKKPARVLEQTTRTNTQILVVSTPVEPQPEVIENSTTTGIEEGEGTGEAVEGTGVGSQIPETTAIQENQFVANPEVMPAYRGGIEEMMKFIRRKIKYPATPRRLGIEGTVYVSFIVNGDGSVSNVAVLRGIHMACDEEAMRVVSLLPGWIGGRQSGIPVSVRMVLPIKFSLEGSL